jgi:hypothetical protein
MNSISQIDSEFNCQNLQIVAGLSSLSQAMGLMACYIIKRKSLSFSHMGGAKIGLIYQDPFLYVNFTAI